MILVNPRVYIGKQVSHFNYTPWGSFNDLADGLADHCSTKDKSWSILYFDNLIELHYRQFHLLDNGMILQFSLEIVFLAWEKEFQ